MQFVRRAPSTTGGFLAEETLRTVVLRRLTTARRHRRHRLSGGASAWAELRAADGLLAAPRRALRLGGYADEEAEARMAAERVAKEAVKEKQRIQEVCDLAETLRMTAEARASEARSRMLAAESKCAARNSARNSAAQLCAIL